MIPTYPHPGYGKPYPITTVLRDLAAQEGCDGEPYDVMIEAARLIDGYEEKAAHRQRNARETWEAMVAMRDAINEFIPMPSLESDLLQGPENWVFCATVAEAVITAVQKREDRGLERAAKHLLDRIDVIVAEEGSYEPDTNVTNLPEWAETEREVLETRAAAIMAMRSAKA